MKKKIFVIIITVIIAVSCVTVVACSPKTTPSNDNQETNINDIGGMKVNESVGKSMNITSFKLMSDEYETYGVTESAESAFVLTATITPATATNKPRMPKKSL